MYVVSLFYKKNVKRIDISMNYYVLHIKHFPLLLVLLFIFVMIRSLQFNTKSVILTSQLASRDGIVCSQNGDLVLPPITCHLTCSRK